MVAIMCKNNIESLGAISRRISSDGVIAGLLQEAVVSGGFRDGFYGFINPFNMQLPLCSTLPLDWWDYYAKNRLFEFDPLVSALANRRRVVTFIDLKDTPAFKNVWVDKASKFDVSPPSVGVPMFGPSGETAIMVLMGSSLPVFDYERQKKIKNSTDIAINFHEKVMETADVEAVLGIPRLTHREKTCLFLASRGGSVADIAYELGISLRTVESHLRETRKKLNAKNTVHAVAKAVYLGIIIAA